MTIRLLLGMESGSTTHPPGAILSLSPALEADLVSTNRATWVTPPALTGDAGKPVQALTTPGGGNRIPGRYDPITIRPLYPAGYTKAPTRAPAVPIGTSLINGTAVVGTTRSAAVDAAVTFNGRPTTRLTIDGPSTSAYAMVETTAATYTLPADAQLMRERAMICAVRLNGVGTPKSATSYVGNTGFTEYEAYQGLYVGDVGGWSVFQRQSIGPSLAVGTPVDLASPVRARLRVDTNENVSAGQMWFAEPYTLPAPRPTVVWTSDDGYDEWEWVAAEAQKRGLKLSFGVSEPLVGTPGYLTVPQVVALQNKYGHEVTNHGGDNTNYSAVGLDEYMRRVNSCRDFLTGIGIDPVTARLHQYVQGVNDGALRAAMRAAGYLSARQTSSANTVFPSAGVRLVGPSADVLYNITTCVSLGSATTLDQVKAAITTTVKGGPAFIVGHRYEATAGSTITWINGYDSQFGALDLMDWLAERRDVDGWRIMTWREWYEDLFDSQIGVTV